MTGLRFLGLIGWLASRGGQRAIAVLVGFKVSRERLRRGCSEEEGSSYSVQDDEQIGYSGRADGRTTGLSRWTGTGQEVVPEHKMAWSTARNRSIKVRWQGERRGLRVDDERGPCIPA